MNAAPPKLGLTERQNEVLKFLREFSAEHEGIMPTLKQISDQIGNKSKTTAFYLVEGLVKRGYIQKVNGLLGLIEGPQAGLEKLAEYLNSHPWQAINLEYNPDGYSNAPGDERYWKATLRNPIGSKIGYLTATFERLIDAIVNERS